MIRLLLVAIFLMFFAIFSLPMYLIQYFVGKKSPDKQFRIGQKITVAALNSMLFLSGTKKNVIGTENIPKDEAVLYVANHRSYFDILLGYTTVPNLTSFVAKKEMLRIPCIRTWMRYMRCLFLDRDDAREGLKTILQGIEQLKEGYSVFIMPEGTRVQEEEMIPFHDGSFKLAEKSGSAIIPVAITNTDNIFENHVPWIKKSNVTIMYGKPIYMQELEKEERKRIGSYVQGIIRDMYNEIKEKGIDKSN